uniref:Abhydrolase domain-containing protein 2 n=1 Tax=Magallana gigas TaxID=29159 RepID=K1Q5W3_MAGGI|eukprot:XP_011435999.1 PREDICTED: monoacylglycerol lipase ABHD2 [Crassostrea gigas]
MVLCPGIANSSETTYICTFVHYAQERGYRVAVLNHLGALSSAPLTSSRMFTYGGTEEYGAMVDEVLRRHPDTRLMGLGFSMGANVVVKYVGEDISRQEKFLCLMSLCQGYDAEKAIDLGKDWAHLRRMYAYVMTSNQKKMLRRHYDMLLGIEVQEKYNIDPELVLASTTLYELDEAYGRRRAGFESVEEYHRKHSCCNCMDKVRRTELSSFELRLANWPFLQNWANRTRLRYQLRVLHTPGKSSASKPIFLDYLKI